MRGLRVLNLSRILAGPYASMALPDLGADVIKIEDVDQGDDTRRWDPPFQGEDAAYFHSVNRNKRSVAIDLKNPRCGAQMSFATCLSRDPGLTGPRGASLSQRRAR